VAGAVAGLLESLLLGSSRGTGLEPAALVNTAVFYAIIWGAVGLSIGLLGRLLRRPPLRTDGPALGALVLSLMALVLAGGYVNIMFLPSMFSSLSLGVDLVILGCAALLWYVLQAAWRRLEWRTAGRHGGRSPLTVATVIVVAALVAIGASPVSEVATVPFETGRHTEGRNVLLILVDALRADHLGCYGYERPTSPNIDRLAAEGLLFTDAYAQGSRTKETTASLVTSYYASSHGVTDFSSVLPLSSPTMMELASSAGYRTAVVSANSLVSPTFGFGRGVDFFYCDAPSAVGRTVVMEMARNVGFRVGFMGWLPRALRSLDVLLPMPDRVFPFRGGDPRVMNETFLSWLDEDPERDFFAYLHYMDSHAPYAPPPPYDTMYDPGYGGEPMLSVPVFPGSMLPFDEAEALHYDEHRNLIAHYDGAITYFDHELGSLLDELEARGLRENTLIIVVSDHGEEFYDHGGWGHGQSVYEELIRVPLILHMPGVLPGGLRTDAVVRQVDLLPTLMGAVGVEETLEAADFDGVNLWDFLAGGRTDWPDPPVLAEVFHGHQYSRAFRDGRHKLIHAKSAEGERFMLLDLSAYPGETVNVAAALPDLTEALFARLQALVARAGSRRLEAGTTTIDEGTKERLRALGYIR
jgi:arylsulfatase A-like enzyme